MPEYFGPLATGATLFAAISRYGYFIDEKMDEDLRRKLYRALLDTKNKSRALTLFALLSFIFDKLFVAKKSGRPSFTRSALVSLTVLASMTIILAIVSPERAISPRGILGIDKWDDILMLCLLLVFINVLGDYVSLWESRIIIGLMATSHNVFERFMWLIVDFFATVTIYILATLLLFTIILGLPQDGMLDFSGPTMHGDLLNDMFTGGILTFSGYSNFPDMFGLCFYTTLFTSVWVYAFMLGNTFWPVFVLLRDNLNIRQYPVGASMTIGGMILGAIVVFLGFAFN